MMSLARRKCLKSIAVAALFFLSGALYTQSKGAESKDEQGVVLFLTIALGNSYYQQMGEGIKAASSKYPNIRIESRAGDRQDDVTGQRQIIESFLVRAQSSGQSKLRGVILVPADSGPELAGVIHRLNLLKVPVINVDIAMQASALNQAGAFVDGYIGSSNIEGGRLAADLMKRLVPSGGNLFLLNGLLGQTAAEDRKAGFIARLNELKQTQGYQYELRQWNANWSESEAMAATSSIISGGYKPVGIFAANDTMALGVVQAVRSAGQRIEAKPVIIGFDAVPEGLDAIRAGDMTATIAQNPKEMGGRAFDALTSLWAGRSIDKEVTIPVFPILKQ